MMDHVLSENPSSSEFLVLSSLGKASLSVSPCHKGLLPLSYARKMVAEGGHHSFFSAGIIYTLEYIHLPCALLSSSFEMTISNCLVLIPRSKAVFYH